MQIESIEYGGYRIGIPIPFPVKYVYCYLFPKGQGYILIDTGFGERSKVAWLEVFKLLDITPSQISDVYLTHFHPDHSGLSGWMQQLTGANVFIHEIDKEMMMHVWDSDGKQAVRIKNMLIEHGTPKELAERIQEQMLHLIEQMKPLPVLTAIESEVAFGRAKWQVIVTPGHSTGHIVFYEEEEQIMLIGDHVIDGITPNISVWPGSSQTPLQDYLSSLKQLAKLPVKKAYPAHKNTIQDLPSAIQSILYHHEERLYHMEKLADCLSAYEIASQVFAKKSLSPHQWRFAIAETIAHMEYLKEEGRLQKELGQKIIYKQW